MYNNRSDINNNQYTYQNEDNQQTQFHNEQNSKLSRIDPVKLKIIMEIKRKSKNKSMEEILPEILKINQELNRRNMNFTKSETEILLESIEETLSPADRQKFNMIKGFLQ
ncbi:MAG: hypothetical protein ACI4D8_08080 [Wujia sp.]